jgi:hypothetical protein
MAYTQANIPCFHTIAKYLLLKTGSSKTGWGGVIDNTTLKTSGLWSYE